MKLRHPSPRRLSIFGRIDVLVNNVGVAPGDLAERVAEADVDEILQVNIKGTFLVTQTVGRQMIAQKAGRIISISSQAGTVTLRGEAIYCMSKAAINHLMRCLAASGRSTVSRSTLSRRHSYGPMERGPRWLIKTFYDRTLGHIPLGRIGETDDVVGAVVFLASPAASLITGLNLLVDGGWSVSSK